MSLVAITVSTRSFKLGAKRDLNYSLHFYLTAQLDKPVSAGRRHDVILRGRSQSVFHNNGTGKILDEVIKQEA